MFFRLLILLTCVPLVELYILVAIARWLNWPATIGLVIGTGVLGAALARREGLKAVQRIQADLNEGVLPGDAIINAMLILAAGLMLVTPGVLTDVCGFALLTPPIRSWVRARLKETFKRHVTTVADIDTETFVDVEASSRAAEQRSNELMP